jgi:hypothetical protein
VLTSSSRAIGEALQPFQYDIVTPVFQCLDIADPPKAANFENALAITPVPCGWIMPIIRSRASESPTKAR